MKYKVGPDKNYLHLLGSTDYHNKAKQMIIIACVMMLISSQPAKLDIQPVSVYTEKIILARRDGIKLPFKCTAKFYVLS